MDLEHLEALDDDATPEPDLGEVRGRGRSAAHAQSAWTAAAAGVVVLGGAGVAVAALRNDDHSVQVVGPSGTTSVPRRAADHPTSSGTLPNGLPISSRSQTPTVVLGDDVRADSRRSQRHRSPDGLDVDPIDAHLSAIGLRVSRPRRHHRMQRNRGTDVLPRRTRRARPPGATHELRGHARRPSAGARRYACDRALRRSGPRPARSCRLCR